MTKNEDLKACPWCNGKAYINNFKSQPCQLHGDRETMWRIQCKHKDAKWMDSSSLPECHVKPVVVASTREEAIERWNTRPTVTPADGDAENAKLVRDLVTENDRAVKQALKNKEDGTVANPDNNALWETCFGEIIKRHIATLQTRTPPAGAYSVQFCDEDFEIVNRAGDILVKGNCHRKYASALATVITGIAPIPVDTINIKIDSTKGKP